MLKRIDAIVISHQHEPDASIEQITEDLKAQVIGPVLGDTGLLDKVLSKYVVYASIA
jgi:S-adenosylmethionine synthetase